MRRIWLVLAALCSLQATLLSGCPTTPPVSVDHGGGNGGGSGGGGGGNGGNGGM
jgi:hypothetical protein